MAASAHPCHLRCQRCATNAPAAVDPIACRACGGLFEVVYDLPPDGETPRLPIGAPDLVSLGEGNTPTVELPRLARELGLARLWVKLEYFAPTCSFKDRGSAVLVSLAKAQGLDAFVEDSSGNAGASMSAYASAAGLRAHVFAPRSAGQGKKDQIRLFGAALHEIDGPRQAATDAAVAFAREHGWLWLSHNVSPFFAEGMKSFAYELLASPAAAVEHVVFPTGNGSLLLGVHRGLLELREACRVTALPRLHAAQARHVPPIVAELEGWAWSPSSLLPTVASGIAVSHPPSGHQVVAAVRATKGHGVAVEDEAIVGWQRRLAREGLFIELTSAAAFAGVDALRQRGIIAAGASVLVPITGSGLKEAIPPDTAGA